MTIDDATRTVLWARESFLSSSSALDDLTGVRPEILASWRRSLSYGLTPERCTPTQATGSEANARLRKLARMVADSKRAALEQSSCCLALTDNDGRLLDRWVTDRGFTASLDRKLILPEFSVAEGATGTGSSSIVLESGRPVTVAGPEHFNEDWIDLTCAGAPIRNPITRRLVGSLNLTVRLADTSPVLLSWVTDIAAEIERALLDSASTEEKLLLSAFLAAKRDARHPVICLNSRTVISNSAAARMLSPVDQALVWEVASKFSTAQAGGTVLTLTDGTAVLADVTAVSDGAESVGAVVRLIPTDRTGGSATAAVTPVGLPGLVGSSEAWRRLCARAAAVTDAPTLIIGEEGSGKMAVASAIVRETPLVVDAAENYRTQEEWGEAVRSACSATSPVILRHLDCLDAEWIGTTARLLHDARERGVRVCATFRRDSTTVQTTPLLDWFDEVLEVPPLSERIDDIGLLLQNLSKRYESAVHDVRWLPDAVQIMTRVVWPRNVASLDSAVRNLMSSHRKPTIAASDLPTDLRARASRRTLLGLEHIEAKAIIEALRNADGNKRLAADTLGIARSTLYRKVRALGIDLSASNY